MSTGLLDHVDATAAPKCKIPKISAGSKVQYATKYDSQIWYSGTVLQVWGNGKLTIRYTDANGIDITRENVAFVEDEFARWREYTDSCEKYGEGGVWKLDDAAHLMQSKLEALEAQVAALTNPEPKEKKRKEPEASGGF